MSRLTTANAIPRSQSRVTTRCTLRAWLPARRGESVQNGLLQTRHANSVSSGSRSPRSTARSTSTQRIPRDSASIQRTVDGELAKARDLQAKNSLLAAARQYQSLIRDFKDLTDVSSAENSLAELNLVSTLTVTVAATASNVDIRSTVRAAYPGLEGSPLPRGESQPDCASPGVIAKKLAAALGPA